MYDTYREACLSKNKKKKAKLGFAIKIFSRKTVQDSGNTFGSSVNKKFRAQQSIKEVMLIVFWDMKQLITIDFLEKSATVNCTSYYQLLRQNLPYSLNDRLNYIVLRIDSFNFLSGEQFQSIKCGQLILNSRMLRQTKI